MIAQNPYLKSEEFGRSTDSEVNPENMAGDGADWRLQIWEINIGLGRYKATNQEHVVHPFFHLNF